MRTALVHDWLTGMRGGEKVLELLCELLPDSDLFTLVHVPGSVSPVIERQRITTSWISRVPFAKRHYRCLLPLMPLAARSLRLRGYDLVVAVSHSVAHGVTVDAPTRFVCYCNTPMRYAWNDVASYFRGRPSWDLRYWGLRAIAPLLREWDRRASRRVDDYIANSMNVQQRIRHAYGRDSIVVYPYVDTDFYCPNVVRLRDFYLWVGALAPYKRIDVALDAFGRLNRKLVVIGDGQELAQARKVAPRNVRFLGWQPDEVVREHYWRCRALIFPGEDDFGIVPLEAQSCGRPVIAFGKGGALETVVDLDSALGVSPTGLFFHDQTGECLADAVRRFEQREDAFDPDAARANALRFSRDRCKRALTCLLFGPHVLAGQGPSTAT